MNRVSITRRGLTLMELMLALLITALVAGAISSMMGAVTTGVTVRQDTRSTMVRANAAFARLSAYVAPSRCILEATPSGIILWFNDSRAGDTVHATEIRWLIYDAARGELEVHFVRFPDSWTQAAKDAEDREYALGTNWMNVLAFYQGNGWAASFALMDDLDDVIIKVDEANALDARHIQFSLDFPSTQGSVTLPIPATIRQHEPPVS